METKSEYLTDREYTFFNSFYNENKEKSTTEDKISFENFKDILFAKKTINKTILKSSGETIKTQLEKDQYDTRILYLTRKDYYKYIEKIMREQDLMANENDPEMKNGYELLSGNKDALYKKQGIDIIVTFELPIKIEDFFAPVKNKDELSFSDFCSLFKKTPGMKQNLVLETFYSTFGKLSECRTNPKGKEAMDIFPIKYVPH